MRRISLLLFLGLAAVAVVQGQPTITSLQSGFNTDSGPQFGAAITSGTNIGSFVLYVNGSFTQNLSKVEWTNTATNLVVDFGVESGIVSITTTQVAVMVPSTVTGGSLFATAVNSPQTVNITVTDSGNVSAPSPFILNPALGVPASLPAGTIGHAYPAAIFNGGTGPYQVFYAESQTS